MLLEDLQESDVLWPDTTAVCHHQVDLSLTIFSSSSNQDNMFTSSDQNNMVKWNSTPIAIPRMTVIATGDRWDGEASEGLEEQMVPPHILVSRRVSEEMAFSICDGLRWRELSFLRDEVLRIRSDFLRVKV